MNKRDYAIDLIKTLAIMGVIIIHTCPAGYSLPTGGWGFKLAVTWGALARGSVPLFFMCSGALMLNRPYRLKRLYLHSILRIALAMYAFAGLYSLYHLLAAGNLTKGALIAALKDILLFKQEFHLYYLHIILLVYALLPVLKQLTLNKAVLKYSLIIWFLLGILYPTLLPFKPFALLSGIPRQWLINMAYSAMGYCLMGYYLKNNSPRPLPCFMAAVTGFVLTFGLTLGFSCHQGSFYSGFFEGMTLGPWLMAVGTFGILINKKVRYRKLFAFVSKRTFYIYLVHVFFLYLLKVSKIHIHPAFDIPCLAIINFALSLATAHIIYTAVGFVKGALKAKSA